MFKRVRDPLKVKGLMVKLTSREIKARLKVRGKIIK